MGNGSTRPGSTRLATAIFVACFAVILYFLYRIFAPYLSALLWAFVLTAVFFPLFRFLLRRVRGMRTAAAFITCLLILLLIVLPVTFLGVVITRQSVDFYQSLQDQSGLLADASASLRELQSRPAAQWLIAQVQRLSGAESIDLHAYMREAAGVVSRFLVGKGPSLLRNIGEMIFSFFLIFITMFFLFKDGPQLMESVRTSSPLPEEYEREIIRIFEDVSYATFFGSLLTAVVQGIAAFLLFLVLGLPWPLFWGAMVALMSLVPLVGGLLIWLPWSAYLLLAGQTTKGILLLAIGTLVIGSFDNVIKPLIVQGRTNMHPLLVFLSVLGGLQAFGFLGILLGPLVVALFVSFLNFYRKEFQESLRKQASASPSQRS